MAAVYLTTEQKIYVRSSKLSRWCQGQLKSAKYTQCDFAKYLGTTPQNISQRFKNDSVTIPMLIAVCTMCDVPADELERILKV